MTLFWNIYQETVMICLQYLQQVSSFFISIKCSHWIYTRSHKSVLIYSTGCILTSSLDFHFYIHSIVKDRLLPI